MSKKQQTIPKKWTKKSSEKLFEHPRIMLAEDEVILPNGTVTKYLKFERQSDGVIVIAVHEDKILVQQEYSYPPNKVMYEFPGGAIDSGESTTDAGLRELLEETQYQAEKITQIGWFYYNNRRTDAKQFVVIANNLTISNEQISPDPEEQCMVEWMKISVFDDMIRNGEIVNFSMLAAWAIYRSKNI